jgi:hypothetical protein
LPRLRATNGDERDANGNACFHPARPRRERYLPDLDFPLSAKDDVVADGFGFSAFGFFASLLLLC